MSAGRSGNCRSSASLAQRSAMALDLSENKTFPLQISEILQRAEESCALTREEGIALIEGGELQQLLESARRVRDKGRGNSVSFSKKIFIPMTNLCRDYCGYCTFRKDWGEEEAWIMTPDQVLALAEEGARLGCKEALFSLGDKPELAFPEARRALERLGHKTTLSYLAEMSRRVLEETGLLPHANPGLMTAKDLERLRPYNASMGIMLENVSERLMEPGMPHHNAPDKHPRARLRTIGEAGRLRIAFTTGLLIGIGETRAERVDSLLAIRELHRRYGHIQEVIVQNFRRKPDIPMRDHPEPGLEEMLRTVAVARLLLGPNINIQAPPNLTENYELLLDAGINDWGGISPLTRDFINPEAPWPHLCELQRRTEQRGFRLRERLAVYPEFISHVFLDKPLLERARALAGSDGYVN